MFSYLVIAKLHGREFYEMSIRDSCKLFDQRTTVMIERNFAAPNELAIIKYYSHLKGNVGLNLAYYIVSSKLAISTYSILDTNGIQSSSKLAVLNLLLIENSPNNKKWRQACHSAYHYISNPITFARFIKQLHK